MAVNMERNKGKFLISILGGIVVVIGVALALAAFLGLAYFFVRLIHWAWYH